MHSEYLMFLTPAPSSMAWEVLNSKQIFLVSNEVFMMVNSHMMVFWIIKLCMLIFLKLIVSSTLERRLKLTFLLQTAKLVLDEHFNQDPEQFCNTGDYATWVVRCMLSKTLSGWQLVEWPTNHLTQQLAWECVIESGAVKSLDYRCVLF